MQKMEPAVGIEPTTDGLQNRSSTTELSWPKEADLVSHRLNYPNPSSRSLGQVIHPYIG